MSTYRTTTHAAVFLAVLGAAVACQGDSPTATAGAAPVAVLIPVGPAGPADSVHVSVSPVLVAGENGRCDIPVSVTSASGIVGEFIHGTLTYNEPAPVVAPINDSQLADVVWPIPANGTASGVLHDSEFASPQPAPYTARLVVHWTAGTRPGYGSPSLPVDEAAASFDFECVPAE